MLLIFSEVSKVVFFYTPETEEIKRYGVKRGQMFYIIKWVLRYLKTLRLQIIYVHHI